MSGPPTAIVNETTYQGKTYVQLEGRDRDLWWPKDAKGWTDGHAFSLDELPSLRRKPKEIAKELAAAEKEYRRDMARMDNEDSRQRLTKDRQEWQAEAAEQIAEAEAEVLLHEHLQSAGSGYGSRTWFGSR